MGLRLPPVLMVVIAAILAGLLNLFSKDLLNSGLDPIQICACREGVTAIVFFLILLVYDRSALRVDWRHLWIFLLFGAFNVGSNLCVFTAQQSLPLEVAAALEMTSPYFILVFAYFLFGDRITKRKILAAVMASIGCIFIIGLLNGTEHLDVFGLAVGLLSGMTLAAFTIGGKYVGEMGYSENTAMFYFFLFSALLIAPLTDFAGIYEVASNDPSISMCILLMGVACTLAPNYLVIYAIRRVDPATVSIIVTSSLIVSTLCGVIAFGDPFDWTDVIGIALVLLAIVILDPPRSLMERLSGKADGKNV